jgi:hypothetical protein
MNPFTEKAAARLKAVNPLSADEDNVVRQRSAVLREDRDRWTLKNKDPLYAGENR